MRGHHVAHGVVLSLLLAPSSFAQSQESSAQPANQTSITVTVTDRDHHPVTGLKGENFTLYEDGRPQPIGAVVSGDVPACVGFLVDRSGSMRGRHNAIAAAMGEFIRAGNPGNLYFAVLFNDDALLQEDFTGDATAIEQAISSADARGGTAFYDSVIAAADHLAERKTCQKRVLVLVSDGVDNESRKSLEYTIHALSEDGNPLVYAIGLPEKMTSLSGRGKHALEALTVASGGLALFLSDYRDLRKAAGRLADELHNQYSLTYAGKTGNPQIKVEIRAGGGKNSKVRVNVAQEPAVRAQAAATPSPTAARSAVPSPAAARLRGPDCISGTVVDENQKPVARIRVEALAAFGPNPYAGTPIPYSVTNAQGQFRLAELVKGNYRLYTRPDAYSRAQGMVYRNEDRTPVASSESCANVTLKFLTRFATLKIRLIDAATREPIPDYGIILRNAAGEALSMSRFDQEAGIRVPPGIELTVQAWTRQHLRSVPMTLTTPEAETSREITLELDQRPSTRKNNP